MAKVSNKDEVVPPVRTKSGDLLTEEDIEALAAEAEAGYDLSKAKRQYVGRPSLGEEGSTSPRVSFRMARGLYDAARARAEREGRTVSDVAREAMERYVSEETLS